MAYGLLREEELKEATTTMRKARRRIHFRHFSCRERLEVRHPLALRPQMPSLFHPLPPSFFLPDLLPWPLAYFPLSPQIFNVYYIINLIADISSIIFCALELHNGSDPSIPTDASVLVAMSAGFTWISFLQVLTIPMLPMPAITAAQ